MERITQLEFSSNFISKKGVASHVFTTLTGSAACDHSQIREEVSKNVGGQNIDDSNHVLFFETELESLGCKS